jgi:phosphotriesterase-related protein
MTDRAKWLFEAAVIAAQATGVPILTHCEGGLGAMEQVEFMTRIGFPLSRVVVSHTDKVSDPDYHSALLESGVNLEFDQALRQGEDALTGTASFLQAQIERGFIDQLMLGTDGARRSLWAAYGGAPGLAWLAGDFRGILETVGIGRDLQNQILITNPARFLAMADHVGIETES